MCQTLDLSDSSPSWEKGPTLDIYSKSGAMVSVDGILYLLGGIEKKDADGGDVCVTSISSLEPKDQAASWTPTVGKLKILTLG